MHKITQLFLFLVYFWPVPWAKTSEISAKASWPTAVKTCSLKHQLQIHLRPRLEVEGSLCNGLMTESLLIRRRNLQPSSVFTPFLKIPECASMCLKTRKKKKLFKRGKNMKREKKKKQEQSQFNFLVQCYH